MAKRIAQRIADELCPATARRAEVTAEIARIKKYGKEVGVVNVQDLYGLGEELKMLDEQIADGKKRYASFAKRAFSRTACAAP
jgi:chorismate mutase